jgi:hypothetical protein
VARRIRRPPATSRAPTAPSVGSTPPVLGRTFVPSVLPEDLSLELSLPELPPLLGPPLPEPLLPEP